MKKNNVRNASDTASPIPEAKLCSSAGKSINPRTVARSNFRPNPTLTDRMRLSSSAGRAGPLFDEIARALEDNDKNAICAEADNNNGRNEYQPSRRTGKHAHHQ